MRDFQRSKVYKAERPLQEKAKRIVKLEDLTQYVDELVKKDWFRFFWPKTKTILVKDGRGRGRGIGWNFGSRGEIAMPVWTRNELYLLHEISHAITPNIESNHGEHFTANTIRLAWNMIGPEVANNLWINYRMHKVKIFKEKDLAFELSNKVWEF